VGRYDAGAPAGYRDSNTSYIKDLLAKEPKLIEDAEKVGSEAAERNLLRQMRTIKGFADTNAAVCAGDYWVSNNHGVNDMANAYYVDCTESALKMLKTPGAMYNDLKSSVTTKKNIPC